ncbi:MAG: hypothetical protein M1826_007745 [Phylliscum demangeonii]|nr:MAG: hypothetical protein M1826_007745 [Phylliscum demangeonii]
MCHPATCASCQKRTWWGCGRHIPSVLDAVPAEQWCGCEPGVERAGTRYPPAGSLRAGEKETSVVVKEAVDVDAGAGAGAGA